MTTKPVHTLSLARQQKFAKRRIFTPGDDNDPLLSAAYLLDDCDRRWLTLTTMSYAEMIRGVHVAPNWAASGRDTGRPRGFEITLSPRAPLLPHLFADMALASGMISFPIRRSDADSARVIESRRQSLGAMLQTIDNVDSLGGEERPESFTGIFYDFASPAQSLYAVTRAHSPAINAQLHARIRAAEPVTLACVDEYVALLLKERSRLAASSDEKRRADAELGEVATAATDELLAAYKNKAAPFVTCEEFFFRTRENSDIVLEQQRHRAGVLVDTLRCAGIGSVSNESRGKGDSRHTRDEQIEVVLENTNTIDSMLDWADQFERADSLSGISVLNNLASVHTVGKHGFVMHGSPFDDLVHYSGEPTMGTDGLLGLPVSSGPVKLFNLAETAAATKLGDRVAPANTCYFPINEKTPEHNFAGRQNWRPLLSESWSTAVASVPHFGRATATRWRPLLLRTTDPKLN